jgi:hypothetical protein
VSADLAKVVQRSDIRRRLAQLGSYSHPMSPTEVTAFVQEQPTNLEARIAEHCRERAMINGRVRNRPVSLSSGFVHRGQN